VIVGFGPYRPSSSALAPPRTLFTGPLEHRHLVHLLPLADVTVVPSIFPEAFGMVAAEAAAAGSPPLVARHSGLAEVAAGHRGELRSGCATSSPSSAVTRADLRRKLEAILALPEQSTTSSAVRLAASRRSGAGRGRRRRRLLEPVAGAV
jgi:glycosyltransferase involved in cell wall biosynthesis